MSHFHLKCDFIDKYWNTFENGACKLENFMRRISESYVTILCNLVKNEVSNIGINFQIYLKTLGTKVNMYPFRQVSILWKKIYLNLNHTTNESCLYVLLFTYRR